MESLKRTNVYQWRGPRWCDQLKSQLPLKFQPISKYHQILQILGITELSLSAEIFNEPQLLDKFNSLRREKIFFLWFLPIYFANGNEDHNCFR